MEGVSRRGEMEAGQISVAEARAINVQQSKAKKNYGHELSSLDHKKSSLILAAFLNYTANKQRRISHISRVAYNKFFRMPNSLYGSFSRPRHGTSRASLEDVGARQPEGEVHADLNKFEYRSDVATQL